MCIFLGRLLKQLSIYLVILLPLELIGAAMGGLYLFLRPYHRGPLPVYLNWYNNWNNEYPGRGWELYNWLFLRNPLNYFQYKYLGFPFQQVDAIEYDGHEVGDGVRGGFEYIEYSRMYKGVIAYSYYYIKPYTIFGLKKCVRFRMGHKIDLEPRMKTYQWVLVFNPCTTYTGE